MFQLNAAKCFSTGWNATGYHDFNCGGANVLLINRNKFLKWSTLYNVKGDFLGCNRSQQVCEIVWQGFICCGGLRITKEIKPSLWTSGTLRSILIISGSQDSPVTETRSWQQEVSKLTTGSVTLLPTSPSGTEAFRIWQFIQLSSTYSFFERITRGVL